MIKRFLRRSVDRYAKLGKGIKKNQKWKRPTGRDNKMREKRRGYPAVVSIGYKRKVNERGRINEKTPILVKNPQDLEKIKKENIAILGNIGKKKKIEILQKAKEMKVGFHNVNVNKFLKSNQIKKKVAKEKKKEETKKEPQTKPEENKK